MTRVALLWHMHQPFYQDLATGEHILPWVRLHALKDYWGMVALLREFPAAKVTFNLVPSMLVQLEAFAREDAQDRHLLIGLRQAEQLTAEERAYCVSEFFHAHRATMIEPYPRYAELLAKRQAGAGAFSVDELRDLQVWHKLVWIDHAYLDGDPRIAALIEKGRGFSEEDKQLLRTVELEILRRVIPEYREAVERGQVEVSTSPFYHPILPLLCDTDVYQRTHPGARRPREVFRHQEDATLQLTRAIELHERMFGRRPTGLWPSEGSVSDQMVPLVADAGFAWMATDEEILARSLGRGLGRDAYGHSTDADTLYQPYRVGGEAGISCAFRDHTLSDLIGFTYSGWDAHVAADDFVARLIEGGRRFRERTGGSDATIFVILDGENAWEHYPGQGRPFLRALYRRLSEHSDLQMVTMADACATPRQALPSIFPGSWINGDFYIWIGHADDQLAWSQLGDARRAFAGAGESVSAQAREQALEELLIAEGSDWFWWYGDDHSSDHDAQFDDLFRRHLRNVYTSLGLAVPEELFRSNISTRPVPVTVQPPTGEIAPIIDGETSSYFEWLGAGVFEPERTAGAMHQVADAHPGVSRVLFGAGQERLFVRVEFTSAATTLFDRGLSIDLTFLSPQGLRVRVERPTAGAMLMRAVAGIWTPEGCPGLAVEVGDVVELAVPVAALGGTAAAFVVSVMQGQTALEHQPQHHPLEISLKRIPRRGWTA